MKILTAIFMILVITVLGFGQDTQKKIHLKKNPDLMKQELGRLIPIGDSIKTAQGLMEANKFSCSMVQDNNFTIGTEDKPGSEFKNLNFLSCYRTKDALAGFLDPKRLFCMRLWKVALVQKDSVVTDILVYVGWRCEL